MESWDLASKRQSVNVVSIINVTGINFCFASGIGAAILGACERDPQSMGDPGDAHCPPSLSRRASIGEYSSIFDSYLTTA